MSPEGRGGDDDSTPHDVHAHAHAVGVGVDKTEDENEASPEQHVAAMPNAAAEADTREDGGNAEEEEEEEHEDDAPSCAPAAEEAAVRGKHDEDEDMDGTSTRPAQWEEEEDHRRTHHVHVIESNRRREPVEAGEDGRNGDTLLVVVVVVVGRHTRNVRSNIHPAPLDLAPVQALALALALLLHLVGGEPAALLPSRREAAQQLSLRGRQRRQPHRAHRPNAWCPPPRRSLRRPRCYQRECGRSAPWRWQWSSL